MLSQTRIFVVWINLIHILAIECSLFIDNYISAVCSWVSWNLRIPFSSALLYVWIVQIVQSNTNNAWHYVAKTQSNTSCLTVEKTRNIKVWKLLLYPNEAGKCYVKNEILIIFCIKNGRYSAFLLVRLYLKKSHHIYYEMLIYNYM